MASDTDDLQPTRAVGGDRAVLAATTALVAGVGALAFAVSFDAISAYAVATGAFPTHLGWAAPLLVDSFTTAATLVIYTRSRAGQRALLAWAYVAASTVVSTALNVAHAPDTLPARLIAAIPPIAQLAAIELVMSEARRGTRVPARQQREGFGGLRASASGESGGRAGDGEEARGLRASPREQIRELLSQSASEGGAVTGREAAAAAGVGLRRAQELLKELRAELGAATGRDAGPAGRDDGDLAQHPSGLAGRQTSLAQQQHRDAIWPASAQGGSVAH